MKRIIAFIVAAAVIALSASLFGCGNKENGKEQVTSFVFTEPEYTWPENSDYFEKIPAPSKDIIYNNTLINDNGKSWQFDIEKMSYKEFRKYILSLEKKSFVPYNPSSSAGVNTDVLLPENLKEGTKFASWIGFDGKLYLSANWYSEEFLKEIGSNVSARFTFSNYNPFSNSVNQEETTK